MKKLLLALCIIASLLSIDAIARGGASSGGGRGGSSSSAGRSVSSAPASRPTAAPASRTTTVTSTTVSRSTSIGGRYVSPPVVYGGLGMGYGYSNGLLTGLIIGNMLHPAHTVVYAGPGGYANNALLYPDGRVVSSAGQLLGTYQGGVFSPVANGAIVAQAVPADAIAQAQPQPQPVVIHDDSAAVFGMLIGGVVLVAVFALLFLIVIA